MTFRPLPHIVAAVLGLLAFFYVQRLHNAELAGARTVAVQAIAAAQEAFDYADSVEAVAQAHVARVDTIVIRRAAAQPVRDSIVVAAPDTCGPAIAALQADVADADSIAAGYKAAFEEEKIAAARLRASGENVVEAAGDLVNETGGFWRSITPKVGFGAAAGVDPTEQDFDTVIGITLSWEF